MTVAAATRAASRARPGVAPPALILAGLSLALFRGADTFAPPAPPTLRAEPRRLHRLATGHPHRVLCLRGGTRSLAMAAADAPAFSGVAAFLATSRRAAEQILADPADARRVLLCVGNEACDLDSIVSALVRAGGKRAHALRLRRASCPRA